MSRFSKHPSYIPHQTTRIPPILKAEEEFWSMDDELILSDGAAQEMIRSHQLAENLFREHIPQKLGLNPALKGFCSLKGHCTRVAIFSLLINDELNRQRSEMTANTRILASAALLHDLGKLHPEIHDTVMFPGKIPKDDVDAWSKIKRHPAIGREAAMLIPGISLDERMQVAEAIFKHHERQDGKGYYREPSSRIPPESFIISAADTLDAILSKRPGKKIMTPNEATNKAITVLNKCKGTQFSPEPTTAAINLRPNSGLFYNKAA